MIMENEYRYQSNVGQWSASVPVPETEHRDMHDKSGGRLFRATELRVFSWTSGGHSIQVIGPNIKQTGELGKQKLRRLISRDHAKLDFPLAWAAARVALDHLSREIMRDAALAQDEIDHAING
jgi:hypothetical protein